LIYRFPSPHRREDEGEGENTPIPLLRRGGRRKPDGVVADTPLREGNDE